ncbi:MAG: GTP-binding protein [Planctomycetota bacterium]|nr:GTP-binding protein [Planctomycetota bacterium]
MEDPALIRNLGIIAHIDAGKTTVSERILFYAGVEHRMGEVSDGNTVMDWMPEERERGITITAAVTHLPWRGHLLQWIDTPGHVDFTAEVERALRVLDGAVLVLDAVAGVQPQTEAVAGRARKHAVPMLAFINKMDRAGADFQRAVASLRARIHPGAIAVQLPLGAGADLAGVLDLVEPRLLLWDPPSQGREIRAIAVPESERARVAEAREALCAAAAEADDALATQWLSEGTLTPDALRAALRSATLSGRLLPVLCGAALRNLGVQPLLDAVVDWLPSPLELPPVQGLGVDGTGGRSRAPDPAAPACALAFKVAHDVHGDLVFLRLYSGTVRDGDALVHARLGKRVRLHPLFWMHADRREKREAFGPGGIFAVPGLKDVRTGDTLCAEGDLLLLEEPVFPEPVLRRAIEPREPGDRARLGEALALLVREDPSLTILEDEETGAWLLAGLGELHLEVAGHRLERDFRLAVRIGEPRVALVETVFASGRGEGRVELPGESPLRVRVLLQLDPQEAELPVIEFAPEVPGLSESLRRELADPRSVSGLSGPAGHPLRQVRIRILEISLDPPRPAAAAWLLGALQDGIDRAAEGISCVLEPVVEVRVEVPEAFLTSVLGDLQQRRAEILEVDASDGHRTVRAKAALSRLMAYSTAIRSLTQGQAAFDLRPAGLAPVSGPVPA